MSSNIHALVVQTGVGRNRETEKIQFVNRKGKWRVKTWDSDGYEPFADGDAAPKDVLQLLRKEYDVRY